MQCVKCGNDFNSDETGWILIHLSTNQIVGICANCMVTLIEPFKVKMKNVKKG